MASGISKPYGVTRDLSWASLAILRNTPQFHESLQRKLSPPASAIDSLPRVTYRVVEMAKSESLGHFERHCQVAGKHPKLVPIVSCSWSDAIAISWRSVDWISVNLTVPAYRRCDGAPPASV